MIINNSIDTSRIESNLLIFIFSPEFAEKSESERVDWRD